MKAIRVHHPGSPEVLQLEEIPIPPLQDSELLIENKASGINGKDLLFRDGSYRTNFPYTPGIEGAGIVSKKGKKVTNFEVGDRVAYCHTGTGSYAEFTAVSASRAIRLPESIDFSTGCACLVQGLAAHYLTHSTFAIGENDKILVHAAAGGVGLLIVQLAKLKGAKVIGTVSTLEKAQIAHSVGIDHTILYSSEDFETETMKLTDGAGVDVVYDSVGAATFKKSLKILKSRGLLVAFGQSSGFIPPFDVNLLANSSSDRGSFFLTRPTTAHYLKGQEFTERLLDIFEYIAQKKLSVLIGQKYSLNHSLEAHIALANRQTIGKSIIVL